MCQRNLAAWCKMIGLAILAGPWKKYIIGYCRTPASPGFAVLDAWAKWQSGHAAACKAVYAGSIPTLASNVTCSMSDVHRGDRNRL